MEKLIERIVSILKLPIRFVFIIENYLNEKLFKGFLKQLLSMQRESQSAAQTNYNTMVAIELLKDGD